MGKTWMLMSRESEEFKKGLEDFLDKAFKSGDVIDGKIICPCKKCGNGQSVTKEVAGDHLKSDGFAEGHTSSNDANMLAVEGNYSAKLLNAGGNELPSGAQKYPEKIHTFMVELLQLKRRDNLSNKSITMVLDLFNSVLPPGEVALKTYEDMLRALGEEDDAKHVQKKQNKKAASTSKDQAGSSAREENRRKVH